MIHELRGREDTRLILLQGLWLQRVAAPSTTTLRSPLEWALEIAAAGQPLPPVGFVADLGNLALGMDPETRAGKEGWGVPELPAGLGRTYEDHVLGKVYADWTFERASMALRRYQGRDRARGLAFILNQFRERAGFGGVLLNPAEIKALLETSPAEILRQGWELLTGAGLHPLLPELYGSIIGSARRTAEILAPEDVFELEHGTALAELGQRVALRHVLQAAQRLESFLPRHRFRTPVGRHDVPTHILVEDTYPAGGFSSLSNRGSLESLLHSQLAFMETEERPDLFDVKFLRDELLYYARDDNQFLRRRRTFVLALFPDLVQTRFKDAALPWQRGVLLLALVLVVMRKLCAWLSTDALVFEFLFVQENDGTPLQPERSLLEMLLREQISNGTVKLGPALPISKIVQACAVAGRRSLCHCLAVSTSGRSLQAESTVVSRLKVDGPFPALGTGDEEPAPPDTQDSLKGWGLVLEKLLQTVL